LDQAPGSHRVYGRRRGRPLRPNQRERAATLLPQLALTLPRDGRIEPAVLFEKAIVPIWVEIGFGGGEHLAEQAASHPEIGFIGCEVYENGVAKLVREVERLGLGNVRIFAEDGRLLLDALPVQSIDRVFVLFPDPWPKLRHHKRRIVSGATLDRLAEIMRDGAELRLATDDRDYLRWMLERVTGHPAFLWLARRPVDWRERPPDWPQTRYEAKARAAGRAPFFLRLARRPRTATLLRQEGVSLY